MRRGALILLVLLLIGGCAKVPAPVIEPPPATVEPMPAPLPGNLTPVKRSLLASISIDGQVVEGPLAEMEPGPVEIILQFAQPMAPGAVEGRLRSALPDGTTLEWLDPERLLLRVPPSGSFSFYIADALSADGLAVDDGERKLRVSRVIPTSFQLFQPEALLAGGAPLLRGSLPLPEGAGFQFSPDRSQVITYPADLWWYPSAVSLIDVASGRRTRLETGKAGESHYCWAGWSLAGELLLLDRTALLRFADDRFTPWTEQQGFCWTYDRSPDGRYLAAWGPFHLTLIDLETGAGVVVEGEFRPIAQDGGVAPYWSPDGQYVAIGNAERSGILDGPIETVILDRAGQVVRRIQGWWPNEWLADGELLVHRPDGPARVEHARLTAEGAPSPRAVPPEGAISPDGRWLVPYRGTKQLIEMETGRMVVLPAVRQTRWLEDSTLLLID